MGFVLSSKFLHLDGVELTYQLFNIYSLISGLRLPLCGPKLSQNPKNLPIIRITHLHSGPTFLEASQCETKKSKLKILKDKAQLEKYSV